MNIGKLQLFCPDEEAAAQVSAGADTPKATQSVNEGSQIPDTVDDAAGDTDEAGAKAGEAQRTYTGSRMKDELAARLQVKAAAKQYERLVAEAEDFSGREQRFDLVTELKDQRFLCLISSGFGIEEAWRVLHSRELTEEAVREAEQRGEKRAVALLRSGSLRPEENGAKEQGGITRDESVNRLSGNGIREILRKVEKGAKIKF